MFAGILEDFERIIKTRLQLEYHANDREWRTKNLYWSYHSNGKFNNNTRGAITPATCGFVDGMGYIIVRNLSERLAYFEEREAMIMDIVEKDKKGKTMSNMRVGRQSGKDSFVGTVTLTTSENE